jgi:hypothetical protein
MRCVVLLDLPSPRNNIPLTVTGKGRLALRALSADIVTLIGAD